MREEKGNILVSVIILTFNHEKYVGEAISSVLEQEFDGPCELLIGDDASNDDTPGIIESIEERPNWVINKVLREENVGMQRNFLDLLERASGKYIAFCDGDDYWTDSQKLLNQYRAMEANHDLAITYHDCKVWQAGVLVPDEIRRPKHHDSDILELASGNFMRTASVMVRNGIKSYPKWILDMPNPDYAVWMLHASGGKIRKLEFEGAVYRKHDSNNWSSMENSVDESLQVVSYLQLMKPHFSEQVKRLLNDRLARVAFYLYRHFLSVREGKKALGFLSIAKEANSPWVSEKLQHIEKKGGQNNPSLWGRLKRLINASN